MPEVEWSWGCRKRRTKTSRTAVKFEGACIKRKDCVSYVVRQADKPRLIIAYNVERSPRNKSIHICGPWPMDSADAVPRACIYRNGKCYRGQGQSSASWLAEKLKLCAPKARPARIFETLTELLVAWDPKPYPKVRCPACNGTGEVKRAQD